MERDGERRREKERDGERCMQDECRTPKDGCGQVDVPRSVFAVRLRGDRRIVAIPARVCVSE